MSLSPEQMRQKAEALATAKHHAEHASVDVMNDSMGSGTDVFGDVNQQKAFYPRPDKPYDPQSNDRMPNAKGKNRESEKVVQIT